MGARDQQRQETAERRHDDVREHQPRPFQRVEHRVEDDQDDRNGDRNHDHQPSIGAPLARALACPINAVTRRQARLPIDRADRLLDGAAQIAAANAVLDGHVPRVALSVDLVRAVRDGNAAQLRQRCFGVSVQTGIIMLEYINQLRTRGQSIVDAAVEGAVLRLRPIMMTTLVATLGLLPAAMSHGIGSDSQRPFAIVIVGGPMVGSLINMFLLPTLYVWAERDHDILPAPDAAFDRTES